MITILAAMPSGCPAGSWKPSDDGENECDWALYIRAGAPSNTRQRAERAAMAIINWMERRKDLYIQPKQLADIIAAELE